MLIRIVKMSFQLDKLNAFLQHFEQHRQQIRYFEGCQYLQILQDAQNPNVLFSYSYWASAEHLEAYRRSEFFQLVWRYTKTLFDAPPQAWTTQQLDLLL
jgi:quinol monooxygenase YgiN